MYAEGVRESQGLKSTRPPGLTAEDERVLLNSTGWWIRDLSDGEAPCYCHAASGWRSEELGAVLHEMLAGEKDDGDGAAPSWRQFATMPAPPGGQAGDNKGLGFLVPQGTDPSEHPPAVGS